MKNLHIEKNIVPLYQMIQKDIYPIYIWGVGALANHAHAYCDKFDIKVSGFFVNTVVNEKEFQGLPVFELNELIKNHQHFSVIIGHSNYEKGLHDLDGIQNVENVYCISALCYSIYHLITEEFIKEKSEIINHMFEELEDDLSKGCLQSYFETRINDNSKYMFPYYKQGNAYYLNDIFELGDKELLLDIGAFVGNMIWPFVESTHGKYKGIIAVEPDEENFTQLQENVEKRRVDKVILRKECIYNRKGYVNFNGEQEYGGIFDQEDGGKLCLATTIDSLCTELGVEQDVSIIKINFPYAVSEILEGGKFILQKTKPKIIIRAGFDENVLLSAYEIIKKTNPEYKIYLRYTIGMPQGLTLFAI